MVLGNLEQGFYAEHVFPLFFVLGLALGSFGNVLLYRLPRGESITGRSRCPSCSAPLRAVELIPLLSFLLLRGKCRHCGVCIPLQYPLVEGGSALLFLLALCRVPHPPDALLLSVALWLLFVIALLDARTSTIPDVLSIPFVLIALATHAPVFFQELDLRAPLIVGAFFGLQWVISRGKWIGSGDLILGIGIAVLLRTWELTLAALWFAYVIGGLVAFLLLFFHRVKRTSTIPFAPFLAVAVFLVLLFEGYIKSTLSFIRM